MLNKDDYALLEYLTDNNYKVINDDSTLLNKILYYENRFQINSFDIIYNVSISDNSKNDFKKAVFDYLKSGGNPLMINRICPIIYYGISNQDKETTRVMTNLIFNYYNSNSAIVISNKNPNYKRLIYLMNKKQKMVVLFTNNKDDFNIECSNLITIHSIRPNLDVLRFSTKYLLPIDADQNCLGEYKDKVIFI